MSECANVVREAAMTTKIKDGRRTRISWPRMDYRKSVRCSTNFGGCRCHRQIPWGASCHSLSSDRHRWPSCRFSTSMNLSRITVTAIVCGHRAIAFCALRRRLSAACSCDSADRSSTNRRFRHSHRSGCAAKSVELISTVPALPDSRWQQRNKALQSSIMTRKSRKFSVARDFRCDLAAFD